MLDAYPVIVRQCLAWGEMDAFQHVNNIVYFRYFENVRLEYFQRIGWTKLHEETGIGPILASIEARFKRPLAYPDALVIGARIPPPLGEDRLTMEYAVASERLGGIACEGKGLVVCYDYRNLTKAPLPQEIRERITHLEGWAE